MVRSVVPLESPVKVTLMEVPEEDEVEILVGALSVICPIEMVAVVLSLL